MNSAANYFPINSRYRDVETGTLSVSDGREGAERTIVYLKRRFLPPADSLRVILEHPVALGERLDSIAAQHLGDPELFWLICDANNAIRPEELTETPGAKLNITLPAGITGAAAR